MGGEQSQHSVDVVVLQQVHAASNEAGAPRAHGEPTHEEERDAVTCSCHQRHDE